MKQTLGIILISIVGAILYGIAHDLVTAHLCVEYFLPPYHDLIIPTRSPLTLAFVWGVVATWWVGAIGGLILAAGMRAGRLPQLTAREMIRPLVVGQVALYLLVMALGGALWAVVGDPLTVVGIMHVASYIGGAVLILFLFGLFLRNRVRLATSPRSGA